MFFIIKKKINHKTFFIEKIGISKSCFLQSLETFQEHIRESTIRESNLDIQKCCNFPIFGNFSAIIDIF